MKRRLLYILAAMLCAMMMIGGCGKVDSGTEQNKTEESASQGSDEGKKSEKEGSEKDAGSKEDKDGEFKPMEPDEDATIELDEDEDYVIN